MTDDSDMDVRGEAGAARVWLRAPEVVGAVLSDPRFSVVPPGPDEEGGLGWVRRTVGRFSEGDVHARRRAFAEDVLAGIGPESLRAGARGEAAAATGDVDAVARRVPTVVLGRALGVRRAADLDALVEAVAVVAAGYLTGAVAEGKEGEVDRAVGVLMALLGSGADGDAVVPRTDGDGAMPSADEAVAGRIGLLLQAYEATAALVHAALRTTAGGSDDTPARTAIADALRHAPPVPALRRVTVAEATVGGRTLPPGTAVRLDVAAAGLPFGGGRRPCPGEAHARAIAEGIVEAVRTR